MKFTCDVGGKRSVGLERMVYRCGCRSIFHRYFTYTIHAQRSTPSFYICMLLSGAKDQDIISRAVISLATGQSGDWHTTFHAFILQMLLSRAKIHLSHRGQFFRARDRAVLSRARQSSLAAGTQQYIEVYTVPGIRGHGCWAGRGGVSLVRGAWLNPQREHEQRRFHTSFSFVLHK